jgi:hypothetical protein
VRVNGHASDANGGTIDLLIQPITEQGAPVGESISVIAVRNQAGVFGALPVVALPGAWRAAQIVAMLILLQSIHS